MRSKTQVELDKDDVAMNETMRKFIFARVNRWRWERATSRGRLYDLKDTGRLEFLPYSPLAEDIVVDALFLQQLRNIPDEELWFPVRASVRYFFRACLSTVDDLSLMTDELWIKSPVPWGLRQELMGRWYKKLAEESTVWLDNACRWIPSSVRMQVHSIILKELSMEIWATRKPSSPTPKTTPTP